MIYLDKVKLNNKSVFKVTHLVDDVIFITKYFDDQASAHEFAEMYANKRNCKVDSSIVEKKTKKTKKG
tara:strand:+ start:312 stop:515 length:204 start_codon:yes stop_codon:yes gene_type:complete